MADTEVIVIGGGLAGLTCMRELTSRGVAALLLEGKHQTGGRAVSENVDGFILDRGFQVFLTAYPEAQEQLDYGELDLRRFEPGALVRFAGQFHRFADPWRRPRYAIATALSPVATFADKLRIARFRRRTTQGTLNELYDRPDRRTIDLLRDEGFSSTIIDRFFRPFLGGVFLDAELNTSSRLCEFVFRMFALGDAAIPAQGMGALARQMADRLPSDCILLEHEVASIAPGTVTLADGRQMTASAIVVATEAPAAARLLGAGETPAAHSVTCLYYAAAEPPIDEPTLVLNGDSEGPINNLCVPSQVASSYAPAGRSLVSATVLGDHSDEELLERQVRKQLQDWFGGAVCQWRHLRTYRIRYALPSQTPPSLQPVAQPPEVAEGIYRCGDYCDTASINGAMASGRRAAEAVSQFLTRR